MTQIDVPEHLVPALKQMLATSTKKRNDYSRVGPWANFQETAEFFRLEAWQSAIFNVVQKLCRVQSLSDGRVVMNEPLADTLLDLANYALFAYAMYLEERPVPAEYQPPKPRELDPVSKHLLSCRGTSCTDPMHNEVDLAAAGEI